MCILSEMCPYSHLKSKEDIWESIYCLGGIKRGYRPCHLFLFVCCFCYPLLLPDLLTSSFRTWYFPKSITYPLPSTQQWAVGISFSKSQNMGEINRRVCSVSGASGTFWIVTVIAFSPKYFIFMNILMKTDFCYLSSMSHKLNRHYIFSGKYANLWHGV